MIQLCFYITNLYYSNFFLIKNINNNLMKKKASKEMSENKINLCENHAIRKIIYESRKIWENVLVSL